MGKKNTAKVYTDLTFPIIRKSKNADWIHAKTNK